MLVKFIKTIGECFSLQIMATILAADSSEVIIVMGLAEALEAEKSERHVPSTSHEPFPQHCSPVPAGSVTFFNNCIT